MEKINILVVIHDTEYRKTLIEYMRTNCRNYVIGISDYEVMSQKIDRVVSKLDVILMDEISFNKMDCSKRKNMIKKIIVLIDSRHSRDLAEIVEYQWVEKYSNVDNIIRIIDGKFNLADDHQVNRDKPETEMIVCFGLSGGSGCSTISSGIAARISKTKDCRVLYLSLDTFESVIEGLPESIVQSHEKVMYSMFKNDFENKNNIIENNMIQTQDGVWRLPLSPHRNMISELDFDEKKKYIRNFIDRCKFDYFIVDGGNYIDEFSEYLMFGAHNILLIDRHGSTKKRYLNDFANHIGQITSGRAPIVVENFANDHMQTYDNAITIRYCSNEEVGDNIEFNTDLQKIIEQIG